jgi:hypothetical protein
MECKVVAVCVFPYGRGACVVFKSSKFWLVLAVVLFIAWVMLFPASADALLHLL